MALLTTIKKKKVDPKAKELIVFDFDGTLVESKSHMDKEMAALVRRLLGVKKVALIGGGKYDLIKKLFIGRLRASPRELRNLYLFPTTASLFYRYGGKGWQKVYAHELSKTERENIMRAFERAFQKLGYAHPKKVYGELIEDRGTQVTFSALGQEAPVAAKKRWTKQYAATKMRIRELVQRALPKLEVRAAGFTSIDVTRRGIDKAYGIRQIEKYVKVPKRKMLFVGDSLFPGGNDHAALKTGVDCIEVKGPEDTKTIIRTILASFDAYNERAQRAIQRLQRYNRTK